MKYKKLPPAKIKEWVVKRYEVKERKNGVELRINNPLLHDEGYHFSINIEKGICGDWRGNEWAGPVNHKGKRNCSFINFVSKVLKCNIKEAIRSIVGDHASYYLSDVKEPEEPKNQKQTKLISIPPGFTPINSNLEDQQTLVAIMFLLRRGYTYEEIEKGHLHINGLDILWPYYEFGELVYWQTRNTLNKKFSFPTGIVDENEKDVGKGDFLYGFDDCIPNKSMILVEAIFDKMTLGDQCCAIGGAKLTEKQVKKIEFLRPKSGIVLAIDNDRAGLESLVDNYEMLKNLDYKIYYSIPPQFDGDNHVKDWNECYTKLKWDKQKIQKEFVNSIKPTDDFLILKLKTKVKTLRKSKKS